MDASSAAQLMSGRPSTSRGPVQVTIEEEEVQPQRKDERSKKTSTSVLAGSR